MFLLCSVLSAWTSAYSQSTICIERPDSKLQEDYSGVNQIANNGIKNIEKIRKFDLNEKFINNALVKGDTINLFLFENEEYSAIVDKVFTDINGTRCTRARISEYPLGYVLIAVNQQSYDLQVSIPELHSHYSIINQNSGAGKFLIKQHINNLDNIAGGHSVLPETDVIKKAIQVDQSKNISTKEHHISATKSANDLHSIDVMVVYTPAANTWASSVSDINTVIANMMQQAQISLDNSNINAEVRLVHSYLESYTEASEGEGGANTDLYRFTFHAGFDPWNLEGSTRYMENVPSKRNQYNADLCILLVDISSVGGLGWLLQYKNGFSDMGYCIVRVQQAASTTTGMHEMGHLMGADHHKQQLAYPGPNTWADWPENTWSAGWRWVGSDMNYYCDLMTYSAGIYWSDGITSTVVPYFSNPSVSYLGTATGNINDGNNALTLSETKNYVAAYRSASGDDYCAATTTDNSTYPMGIQRFICNTIDNTSGTVNNVYENFLHISTNLKRGNTYTATVIGWNYVQGGKIWVDWNKNGNFDDAGEMVEMPVTGNDTIIANITIPIDASLGATRIRVRTESNALPASPCGSVFYGETEDYTIFVTDSDCSSAPTVSISRIPGGPQFSGTEISLSASASGGTSPYTYSWSAQYLDNTDIETSPETGSSSVFVTIPFNNNSYDTEAPSPSLRYIVTVTDNNGCKNTAYNQPTIYPQIQTPQGINTRCQANGTDSFSTGTSASICSGTTGYNGFVWSVNPPDAGTMNPSTGEIAWNASFIGDATISVYAVGCASGSNGTQNSLPVEKTVSVFANPSPPVIDYIVQPTEYIPTGSVTLSNLPVGAWTITANPGSASITGSTNTAVFGNLAADQTYTFTVSSTLSDCNSEASEGAVINAQPTILSDSESLLYINGNLQINVPLHVNGNIKVEGGEVILGSEIHISGDWTNNESVNFLTGNGSVVFNATSETQRIKGNLATRFYNLTNNNTHSGLLLWNNIEVSNNLYLENGDIDLLDYNIDLGNSGSILNESSNSRIKVSDPSINVGTITREMIIDNTGETYINPGNIGVGIKTAGNLGNVIITRGHKSQQGTGTYSDNYSIARYYDITPQTNNIPSELQFYYITEELSEGNTLHQEVDLKMFHYKNDIWEPLLSNINSTENYVLASTSSFSIFTLGSEDKPLPVELLFFEAHCIGHNCSAVQLEWATATEINSDYFEIFRSNNNMQSWQPIGIVDAAGFSNNYLYYTIDDVNLPNTGKTLYYKLKQVDLDGKRGGIYLSAISRTLSESVATTISIYPNPFVDEFVIDVKANSGDELNVQLFDKMGKLLLFETLQLCAGNNQFRLTIKDLPPAMYHLRITSVSGMHSMNTKIIKQF